MKPLADRVRPVELNEIVGQNHIIGEGKLLNRIVQSKIIPNMIFFGPSGTGKTTIANIIAKSSNKKFYKINGTNTNIDDIKHVISQIGTLHTMNGILLYIDELHYLTKRQQQSILEYIENGDITLIGSTTENVNFSIFNALLSRCTTIEFKALNAHDLIEGLKRAISLEETRLDIKIAYEDNAIDYIAEVSGGDLRRSLNTLELIINTYAIYNPEEIHIDIQKAVECSQSKITNYDRDGDGHYNLLSFFQKSIRGSDEQASVHALARLIKSGDLTSICRRLLVIASEDIGLAYPQAISIVKSCTDAALQLGLPEARIPLSQATILLASLPKSNTAYKAINAALDDLDRFDVGHIPYHLCDSHSNSSIKNKAVYLYPHDYPNSYVKQQYMPENIKNKTYYKHGNNKFEQSMKSYWNNIKG
ncbi:replication-associated recombination protein A [Alkaliphilus sp. MSJ-5]|uniref:Replication-associated recombination protein A n=1 Tax=Alkaliphilus flagellatus TaxID=2841507 RepID=A0ABS6G6D3_9FIRM|nr:replication-associated recombination protein A [Alkaliphilus flagellatus]MBU5677928.1 replication-associated recombination protein A [Alkaliphilus flagellatus]